MWRLCSKSSGAVVTCRSRKTLGRGGFLRHPSLAAPHSTRADEWVNVWGGGAKYALKVKLWASWFCMDGGDEQAFLRSLDVCANLKQAVKEVQEDFVLFQNQFLTCIVTLTWDGKGMQAMGAGWV